MGCKSCTLGRAKEAVGWPWDRCRAAVAGRHMAKHSAASQKSVPLVGRGQLACEGSWLPTQHSHSQSHQSPPKRTCIAHTVVGDSVLPGTMGGSMPCTFEPGAGSVG